MRYTGLFFFQMWVHRVKLEIVEMTVQDSAPRTQNRITRRDNAARGYVLFVNKFASERRRNVFLKTTQKEFMHYT